MTAARRKKASKLRTSAYDVAEHLRTSKELAAYLDAWLEEAPDDVSGIARAVGDIARARGMSLVANADLIGQTTQLQATQRMDS
jgi:probable addiction module antidote protein